mmetsp:Transcript_13668/g.18741  ORF Transcript_13668/g.18741 Transcript_13668/m.18741 type:complete len:255 (+) Transcript_13668:91-855(+)
MLHSISRVGFAIPSVLNRRSQAKLPLYPSQMHAFNCSKSSRNFSNSNSRRKLISPLYCSSGPLEGNQDLPEVNPSDSILEDFLRVVNKEQIQNPAQLQRPSALHPPTTVISAQIEALQRNDYPEENSGVMTAYSFALPMDAEQLTVGGSQTHVRSWEAKETWLTKAEFVEAVSSHPYRAFLTTTQWQPASALQFHGKGDLQALQAIQIVSKIDGEDKRFTFTFCLAKVESGPYNNCWMTVGVRSGNYAVFEELS